MAKLNPLEDPPTASSSDDEGEAEEQISDDSSSEEAEPKNPKTKKSAVKPPVVKSGKKRPSGITSKQANLKRAKKVAGSVEDTKTPLFQRLWSEEDEILVLQGMIDFKSDTGKNPYEDMNEFYEFIKKFISFEASKSQFMDKIRSLKRKYVGKLKTGLGFFSMGHDKNCVKLAKIIWGSEVIPHESAIKKNLKALEANCKKVVVEEEEREVFDSESRKSDWFDESFVRSTKSLGGVDEYFVKQRWSKVSVETKKRFEEKWKVLQRKEIELVLEKTEFMGEVSSVILKEMKM